MTFERITVRPDQMGGVPCIRGLRIPVATVSALILGPGTTVTHAAMKACGESNTPVCWTGEDCLRFYALGLTPNHTNDMPRLHAEIWADKRRSGVLHTHLRGAPKLCRKRYGSEECYASLT